MGRFSIRIQVMLLSAGFIVVLLLSTGLSWLNQSALFRLINDKQIVNQETLIIGSLLEDGLEAEVSVLKFAAGADDQIDEALHNLDQIEASVAEYGTLISRSGDEAARARLQMVETASEMLTPLREGLSQTSGAAFFDRKVAVDRDVSPLLLEFTNQLDAIVDVMEAETETFIAETQNGVRVLETAGAPTYYFPPGDVETTLIEFGEMASICEWKGVAQSIHVQGIQDAGWRYIRMFEDFAELHEWPSFYPKKLLCFVDTELVTHQPGGYYGGWVTSDLAGPIKGAAGSESW